jgi:predicted O-linked N-acetylglucosamine transferase (SPINDLY family)
MSSITRHGSTIAHIFLYKKAEEEIIMLNNEGNHIFLRGFELHKNGEALQAAELYRHALSLNPNHADALHLLGVVYLQQKKILEAEKLIRQSLSIKQTSPFAHGNLGACLLAQQAFPAALEAFDAAIELQPEYPEAHFNRGNALFHLDFLDAAEESYAEAIRQNPSYIDALMALARAKHRRESCLEAITVYDRVLTLDTKHFSAYLERGVVLMALKSWREARGSLDKAIEISSDKCEAYFYRNQILRELGFYGEALADIEKVFSLEPENPRAFFMRAEIFTKLGRLDDALVDYSRAISFDKKYYDALKSRAELYLTINKMPEAIADFESILALGVEADFIAGQKIHAELMLGIWKEFDANLSWLFEKIECGEKIASPFVLQSIFDNPDLHRRAAHLFAPSTKNSITKPELNFRNEKIRVAYFSSDFNNHPVSNLMARTIENHDRDNFEIYAFSLGIRKDSWTDRVRRGACHFIDASGWTDKEIVEKSGQLKIDIAVDLNGHTHSARTEIFAQRVAPIQMSYIGFLGSMGAPYYDYLIADEYLIPPEQRVFYDEKILYLPTYQCNDDHLPPFPSTFKSPNYELPDGQFTYCCFNNSYKITPVVFDVWMRILKRVPQSVLWLYVAHPHAIQNLRHEAIVRGIDPERLIFAPRVGLSEHLARHRSADLFLDTSPYNAGATASNALRLGLPVLTCPGVSFASRIGASLLQACDMPELIAHDFQAYEDLAVRIGHDSSLHGQLKKKLTVHASRSRLFDNLEFTRSLERGFRTAYQRALDGLKAEHIFVLPTRPPILSPLEPILM